MHLHHFVKFKGETEYKLEGRSTLRENKTVFLLLAALLSIENIVRKII